MCCSDCDMCNCKLADINCDAKHISHSSCLGSSSLYLKFTGLCSAALQSGPAVLSTSAAEQTDLQCFAIIFHWDIALLYYSIFLTEVSQATLQDYSATLQGYSATL